MLRRNPRRNPRSQMQGNQDVTDASNNTDGGRSNVLDLPVTRKPRTNLKPRTNRKWQDSKVLSAKSLAPTADNVEAEISKSSIQMGHEQASSSAVLSRKPEVCIIYNPKMLDHKSKKGAEELASRLKVIMRKLKAEGLWDRCCVIISEPAKVDDITIVHMKEYVKFICGLPDSKRDVEDLAKYTGDVFFSSGTPKAAQLAVGSVIKACEVVLSGEFNAAFAIIRPPGHHAMPSKADGFCFFNNVAIAAEYFLLKKFLERILILDLDVHHGDGTQAIFYKRKDVLVLSIHSSHLKFPYKGSEVSSEESRQIESIGRGGGRGYNINVNLETGYTDSDMLMVLNQIFLPIANQFNPDLIILSMGYDAVLDDGVGDAALSKSCYATMVDKARQVNTGRLVLALEGGYNLALIPDCAAYTVRSLLGEKEVLLDEERLPDPRQSTVEILNNLKGILSAKTHWVVP